MTIETFRAALQRLTVRGALLAYIARNRPKRGKPPSALQRINVRNARMLLEMYGRRGAGAVLSGFLVPAELLHVYGTSPMFTENLAATIAGAGYASRVLECAERFGFSRDGCSFHRATLGGAMARLLPRFDLVVATSHLCDGQNKTLEELALRTGAPYLFLDVPCDSSPASVEYLSAQLQRVEDTLAGMAGRRADRSDWNEVFACSNATRDLMVRLLELRRKRPSPFYGKAAFSLAFQSALMMGTDFLQRCYQDLVNEIEAKPPEGADERFRVAWLLAYPYFRESFVPQLEKELGIRVVAEEFSEVFWAPLDPARPLESLARKMLQNPNLGPVSNRIGVVERMVRDYRLDGVLHYSHWGCRQGCGGVRPIADALKGLHVPFLDLDGDCIDSRNYSRGQTLTRLQGFVELMGGTMKSVGTARYVDQLFLGVDVGSLSAKAVVINGAGDVLFETVILTGASSRKAVQQLKEIIFREPGGALEARGIGGKIERAVATGYGRGVVDFADAQVTEITCHARGMAHVARGVRTIIDIGGQDTKAIAVGEDGSVRRFAMNDKCAAGTGRFLEMMARTLEIDIDDLGPQALRASRSAPISSMCTVFAESEVVSLIAEGRAVAEIARGVCDSIAARTVSLLERVGRESRFAMSGGVARNTGVVNAIERALNARLELPSNPQTIGALGAALIARDGVPSKGAESTAPPSPVEA